MSGRDQDKGGEFLFATETSEAFNTVREVYAKYAEATSTNTDEIDDATKIRLLRRRLNIVGEMGRAPCLMSDAEQARHDRMALERILVDGKPKPGQVRCREETLRRQSRRLAESFRHLDV